MLIGRPLIELDVVGSTMDEAALLADRGVAEGLAVQARAQTAGRGRSGRTWDAAAGTSLLCSIVLRPRVDPESLSALPLTAGLGLAEAIEDTAACAVQIKWPNDLLIEENKVGGVLMTARIRSKRVEHAVLGFGINVGQKEGELPAGATSLRMAAGVTISMDALRERCFQRLSERYTEFQASGGLLDVKSWMNRAALRAQSVTLFDGQRSLGGTFTGVTTSGALVLRDSSGLIHHVHSGEMTRGPIRSEG